VQVKEAASQRRKDEPCIEPPRHVVEYFENALAHGSAEAALDQVPGLAAAAAFANSSLGQDNYDDEHEADS